MITASHFLIRFPLTSEALGNESSTFLLRREEDIAEQETMMQLLKRIEKHLSGDKAAFKKLSRVELAAMVTLTLYFAVSEKREVITELSNAIREQTWKELK